MNRDEQEMALWQEAYMLAMSQDPHPTEASGWADSAVAEFRKRYPPQPQTPEAVWYDEPPFERDGSHHPCWVEGIDTLQTVYWSVANRGWQHCRPNVSGPYPLAGRRVSPITKPPEPTT